jgi:hypothetical protein
MLLPVMIAEPFGIFRLGDIGFPAAYVLDGSMGLQELARGSQGAGGGGKLSQGLLSGDELLVQIVPVCLGVGALRPAPVLVKEVSELSELLEFLSSPLLDLLKGSLYCWDKSSEGAVAIVVEEALEFVTDIVIAMPVVVAEDDPQKVGFVVFFIVSTALGSGIMTLHMFNPSPGPFS